MFTHQYLRERVRTHPLPRHHYRVISGPLTERQVRHKHVRGSKGPVYFNTQERPLCTGRWAMTMEISVVHRLRSNLGMEAKGRTTLYTALRSADRHT